MTEPVLIHAWSYWFVEPEAIVSLKSKFLPNKSNVAVLSTYDPAGVGSAWI